MTLQQNFLVTHKTPDTLTPYSNNARTHSKEQVRQIAKSIERFGFTNPVLISDADEIIAGHGRVQAAQLLGLETVPTLQLSHLSEVERRAYVIADNKLALNAGWDDEILAIELQALLEDDFEVDLTGFSIAEVDGLFELVDTDAEQAARADSVPLRDDGPAVSKTGDIWLLGKHRLMCGDARKAEDIARLCDGERVDLLFTDPPYNVRINGHVSGLGQHQHKEFAVASGELNADEFTSFLTETLCNASAHLKDGAIAYVCMDWRHISELLQAGAMAFTEMKNLCVWNKTNAGMGTFYRSKHELVFVFKKGTAPHTNAFGLGEEGRYRTNVWDYAGVNSFGAERDEELSMHPTVKPVAMVADAIKDCSAHGEIVLDIFGGSGSTLIAAETVGRRTFLSELDPTYCDTIIKRYEKFSGNKAYLERTNEAFADVEKSRTPQHCKLETAAGDLS